MWQLGLWSKRTGEVKALCVAEKRKERINSLKLKSCFFEVWEGTWKIVIVRTNRKLKRSVRHFSSRPRSLRHASPNAVSLGGKEVDCIPSLCRKGWKSVVFQMWMLCSITPFFYPQASHWDPTGSAWSQFQNCPTWKHFSVRLLWRWRNRPTGAWLRSCASRQSKLPQSSPLQMESGRSESCLTSCWLQARPKHCSMLSSQREQCRSGQHPVELHGKVLPLSPSAKQLW